MLHCTTEHEKQLLPPGTILHTHSDAATSETCSLCCYNDLAKISGFEVKRDRVSEGLTRILWCSRI